jgi:hypothetical protein
VSRTRANVTTFAVSSGGEGVRWVEGVTEVGGVKGVEEAGGTGVVTGDD